MLTLLELGSCSLHDERIAVRVNGDANLGILQGFVPNIRSSGRAALAAAFEGPMRDPIVTGTLRVDDGRRRIAGGPPDSGPLEMRKCQPRRAARKALGGAC